MIILMQQMFLMSRFIYEAFQNPVTRNRTIEMSWKVWTAVLRMYRGAALRLRRLRASSEKGLLRDVLVRGIRAGPEGFAAAADDAVSVVMSEVMSEVECYESCESDLDLETLAAAEDLRKRHLTKCMKNAAAEQLQKCE